MVKQINEETSEKISTPEMFKNLSKMHTRFERIIYRKACVWRRGNHYKLNQILNAFILHIQVLEGERDL